MRRVGRQEQEPGTRAFDGLAPPLTLWAPRLSKTTTAPGTRRALGSCARRPKAACHRWPRAGNRLATRHEARGNRTVGGRNGPVVVVHAVGQKALTRQVARIAHRGRSRSKRAGWRCTAPSPAKVEALGIFPAFGTDVLKAAAKPTTNAKGAKTALSIPRREKRFPFIAIRPLLGACAKLGLTRWLQALHP